MVLIARGSLWLTLGYVLLAVIWTRRELRRGPLRRPFMHSRSGIVVGFALWPLLAALSIYEQGRLWSARGRYMVTDRDGNVRLFKWKAEALTFADQNTQEGRPAHVVDIFAHH